MVKWNDISRYCCHTANDIIVAVIIIIPVTIFIFIFTNIVAIVVIVFFVTIYDYYHRRHHQFYIFCHLMMPSLSEMSLSSIFSLIIGIIDKLLFVFLSFSSSVSYCYRIQLVIMNSNFQNNFLLIKHNNKAFTRTNWHPYTINKTKKKKTENLNSFFWHLQKGRNTT